MITAVRKTIVVFILLTICAACNAGPPILDSTPTGDKEVRGAAWIDWDASELLVMESFPMQVALVLRGDLPTPCDELAWEIAEPNSEGEIHITAYATHDPEEVCAALLEPFEQRIELGDFTEGGYSVWVNEGKVGDF